MFRVHQLENEKQLFNRELVESIPIECDFHRVSPFVTFLTFMTKLLHNLFSILHEAWYSLTIFFAKDRQDVFESARVCTLQV